MSEPVSESLCGLLVLNKPTGVTSRWVVDRVARVVRPAKAGHAGTLDPLATGVVLVCVGRATRLISHLHRMPKTYEATFLLGRESPTEDVEAEVVELPDPPVPAADRLRAAAAALTGEILQRPPAFSALKVDGQRAYRLARRGEEVELAPRPVTIHRLEIRRYDYPVLELLIECSSGTYIRSLGRDLATSLGTAAVMSGLVRTSIGPFAISQALDPTELQRGTVARQLRPPLDAVPTMPRLVVSEDQCRQLWSGQAIAVTDSSGLWPEAAAIDTTGRLVSLTAPAGGDQWRPLCNFPRPPGTAT